MTTVVTGASGHVGANLVRMLLERGEHVRAMVLHDTRGIDGVDVELVRGDVRDSVSLRRAFEGAKSVFHCAAQISIVGDLDGRVHETNVVGAGNVAEAALAAGVTRLVHFSSVHAFDLTYLDGPIDEHAPRARPGRSGAYDCSKWAGEQRVRDVVERGLDAVIVNPTGVIGPGDYKVSRMGLVFRQLQRRTLPALVSGGFDFVDVRDVCQGAIAARERGRTGENYLLAGQWAAVGDLARVAARVTGAPPPWLTAPMWLARIGAPAMTGFAKLTKSEPLYTSESLAALRANREIRTTKAETELGYSKRTLEQSVRDIYAWIESH